MYCPNCGIPVPDGKTLCDGCTRLYQEAIKPKEYNGSSSSQAESSETFSQPYEPPQNSRYTPPHPIYSTPQSQTKRQPLTVGQWILRSLVALIPCVGIVAYIVMLFIWANDKTTEETASNWAKAQLILTAVIACLVILLYAFVFIDSLPGGHSFDYYYNI